MVERATDGLMGSLQRLADTGLSAAKNRLELFSVELREERGRFLEVVSWTSMVLFTSMMAILVFTATIIVMCPDRARPYVAGGFTLLYVGGALWSGFSLRARLKKRAMPFAETISQLQKDRQWLDSLN